MASDVRVGAGVVRFFHGAGQHYPVLQPDPPKPPTNEDMLAAYTFNAWLNYQDALREYKRFFGIAD